MFCELLFQSSSRWGRLAQLDISITIFVVNINKLFICDCDIWFVVIENQKYTKIWHLQPFLVSVRPTNHTCSCSFMTSKGLFTPSINVDTWQEYIDFNCHIRNKCQRQHQQWRQKSNGLWTAPCEHSLKCQVVIFELENINCLVSASLGGHEFKMCHWTNSQLLLKFYYLTCTANVER